MKLRSSSTLFILLALAIASPIMAAATASAKELDTIKVFLLGGQSNMNGYGSVGELRPPYNAALPAIKIWDGDAEQWAALGPKGESFGPEIAFGHAIAKTTHDDVRLIKYAANGTALYNDWAPTKGPQYIEFMRTAKGALADLDSNQTQYEIVGMLWLQGESDAKEGHGEEYEKNLKAFINHLRQAFASPSMRFIIARVRNYYGKGAQAEMVRAAQESVANQMENVTWFDTDDCGDLIRGGHYSSDGLIKVGNRFASSYIDMVTAPESRRLSE